MKKHSILPLLFGVFCPLVVFAQTNTTDATGFDKASKLIDMISNVLGTIQTILLDGGGAIAVLMVVIGGIQYIMNQKDAGKKTITAAIIGIAIIILSSALIALVRTQLEPITSAHPNVDNTTTLLPSTRQLAIMNSSYTLY